MVDLASISVYKGTDPFTLPQTKVVWVKTSIPGVKQPVLKKKWMNVDVQLVVEGPDDNDVRDKVYNCLRGAAIKGLIAGIIGGYATGGAAAVTTGISTFAASLDSCVETELKKGVDISAELRTDSHWDKAWH